MKPQLAIATVVLSLSMPILFLAPVPVSAEIIWSPNVTASIVELEKF